MTNHIVLPYIPAQHDSFHETALKFEVRKYLGEWTAAQIDAGEAPEPYEIIEGQGNELTYGGASCLWECLIGNGTGTAAQTLTFFNNGNAYIGVGDSSTAFAATQTDLQAATNKVRVAMETSYPAHTDGTTSGAASIDFRAVFNTSTGNFAWAEWAVFNGSTGGRMLNRKVASLGTKTSAATWTFTVTLSAS